MSSAFLSAEQGSTVRMVPLPTMINLFMVFLALIVAAFALGVLVGRWMTTPRIDLERMPVAQDRDPPRPQEADPPVPPPPAPFRRVVTRLFTTESGDKLHISKACQHIRNSRRQAFRLSHAFLIDVDSAAVRHYQHA